ncbi:hypothetical protein [Streptomyces sp. NPDC029554]|uniref:hypothetical protein n=1 Tax=Streptomyces sp. NPDC029554 TaxID=3155126 RepID=UPI0033FA1096
MHGVGICWSCGKRARPSSPLRVRLRREEGGGAYLVAVTIAYRKAKVSVPLCAPCKKAWRPALRARMVAVWSLTLGIILVPSALVMGLLMAQQYHDGTIFRLAVGIGGASVGSPPPCAFRPGERSTSTLKACVTRTAIPTWWPSPTLVSASSTRPPS